MVFSAKFFFDMFLHLHTTVAAQGILELRGKETSPHRNEISWLPWGAPSNKQKLSGFFKSCFERGLRRLLSEFEKGDPQQSQKKPNVVRNISAFCKNTLCPRPRFATAAAPFAPLVSPPPTYNSGPFSIFLLHRILQSWGIFKLWNAIETILQPWYFTYPGVFVLPRKK